MRALLVGLFEKVSAAMKKPAEFRGLSHYLIGSHNGKT